MDHPLAMTRRQDAPGRDGYVAHDEVTLRDLAAAAVEAAMRLGASHASAEVEESAGISIQRREGQAANAIRSGSQAIGVRVFYEGRTGAASSGALDLDQARWAAERAMRIARTVEVDEAAAPVAPEWLDRSGREVPLFAPSNLSPGAIGDVAAAIEAAGQAEAGADGLRVLEAGAASQDSRWARAIGRDFCRSGSGSSQQRWCTMIGGRNGRMVRDFWSATDRRTERLESADTVAARAAERTRRKLGAAGLTTRTCPVLFDATVANILLDPLCNALTGRAQDQNATFLPKALGEQRLAAHLDLVEDPFEPFGLASGAHDREGVAPSRRHVVRDGVVEGYFLSSRTARKLGLDPTGTADGPWNLHFSGRDTEQADDLPAMLRRLDRGLWVTEVLGGGINPVTGAFSKAVSGIWVEDGLLVGPVEDITAAANLSDLFANIRHVGADVHRRGRLRSGSILVDAMHIAGR